MTQDELDTALAKHALWVKGDPEGEYAYLRGASLAGKDLSGANLRGADLSGAWLVGADLTNANLSFTVLHGVNFRDADLTGATIFKNFSKEGGKRYEWKLTK